MASDAHALCQAESPRIQMNSAISGGGRHPVSAARRLVETAGKTRTVASRQPAPNKTVVKPLLKAGSKVFVTA